MREPHDVVTMPEWELEELALEDELWAQDELEERRIPPEDPI